MKLKRTLGGLTATLAILILSGALMGMGGKNEGPKKIPIPEQNYSAAIIDRAEVKTEVSMFSIDGFVFFFGQKGKGRMAVPFNKIKKADLRQTGDGLAALLTLKDGQELTLVVNRDQQCFGKTNIGNFQVGLGDVKLILFKGLTSGASQ